MPMPDGLTEGECKIWESGVGPRIYFWPRRLLCTIASLRAELAAAKAEVERLNGEKEALRLAAAGLHRQRSRSQKTVLSQFDNLRRAIAQKEAPDEE